MYVSTLLDYARWFTSRTDLGQPRNARSDRRIFCRAVSRRCLDGKCVVQAKLHERHHSQMIPSMWTARSFHIHPTKRASAGYYLLLAYSASSLTPEYEKRGRQVSMGIQVIKRQKDR